MVRLERVLTVYSAVLLTKQNNVSQKDNTRFSWNLFFFTDSLRSNKPALFPLASYQIPEIPSEQLYIQILWHTVHYLEK